MTQRNRATLGKYFDNGQMPSSEGFAELIESMLCKLDDGIDYSSPDGLRLRQIDANKLLSFYLHTDVQSPIWSIGIGTRDNSLAIGGAGRDVPWLTLAKGEAEPDDRRDGQRSVPALVGINQAEPAYTLDVDGTIAAAGRIGKRGAAIAKADGEWHTISERLAGCHAFEVTAGVGREGTGRYALMHAFALSTFNSKNEISYHQAYFSSKCNRLELRWAPATDIDKDGKKTKSRKFYELQLRVGCNYDSQGGDKNEQKAGTHIQYHLTQLWFDPLMAHCTAKPGPEAAR